MFLRHSVLIFKRINKWPCTPTTMLFDFSRLYGYTLQWWRFQTSLWPLTVLFWSFKPLVKWLHHWRKQQTPIILKKKKLTKESASSAPNASASSLIWAFFGLSSDKKRRTSGLSKDQTNFLEVSISLNSATVESYTCSR